MKRATQRVPLRLVSGELPRSRWRTAPARQCVVRNWRAGHVISTWLYDRVDRNAREIYEAARMTAKGVESRCA